MGTLVVFWLIIARIRGRSASSGALWGRWFYSGTLGSPLPFGSSGLFRFIGFIRARPMGLSVLSGAHLVSTGSFGFVEFIHVRTGGCRVHWGSLGSLGSIVWDILLIRARNLCSRIHLGSLGS